MTRTPYNPSGRTHRRGTALLEFVMAIPFLALLLGLTFFFGWSMKNQQHVKIADRYLAWRHVRTKEWKADRLNHRFFGETAERVSASRGHGPDDTLEDLVAEADHVSGRAGEMAGRLIPRRVHRGRSVRVGAVFPSDVGVWNRMDLTGPITSHHVRDGVQWRCIENVFNNEVVNDQFLSEFDGSLPGDNKLAKVLRILYRYKWKQVNIPDD